MVIIYIQYEAVLCVFDTVREAEGCARDWFDGVQPIYVSDSPGRVQLMRKCTSKTPMNKD